MRLASGPSLGQRLIMWMIGAIAFVAGLHVLVLAIKAIVWWVVVFVVITVAVWVAVRHRERSRW